MIDETAGPLLRERLGTFDGDNGLVIVQPSQEPFPNAGGLWLCCVVAPLEMLEQGRQIARSEDPETLEVARRGIALYGLRWDQLVARQSVCVEQCTRFSASTFDNLAPGLLWDIRKAVFGAPLTKVARAVAAFDAAYVPEEPVSRADLLAVFKDG